MALPARVGLFDHPLFLEHEAGAGHPERPERLEAFRRGLRDHGLEQRLEARPPRPAAQEELRRVHSLAHLERVAATHGRTVRFDADTQAGPHSYQAALMAAGAVVEAVEAVLAGSLDRAFCAVRPPGHHATPDAAMGFCLFNNVAVGAAHALARGLRRVLVVDWDVHHGNGTQDAFYQDPRVLYVSSHAFPFYPGTGSVREVGEGEGRGFTVNLPVTFAAGDGDYARIYREVVAPIARAFDAELVLVSVGFDPHRDDPLAPMKATDAGFAVMADVCLDAARGAAGGKAVFVLEGGYDLDGIASSAAAVTRVLLGEGPPSLPRHAGPALDALLDAYRRELKPYWSGL